MVAAVVVVEEVVAAVVVAAVVTVEVAVVMVAVAVVVAKVVKTKEEPWHICSWQLVVSRNCVNRLEIAVADIRMALG